MKIPHLYEINPFDNTEKVYESISGHIVENWSSETCARTFFVNKQLTLSFNFLQNHLLNFAQNFRECSFNLAGSESGEKLTTFQLFAYISQLFVYKTCLWT